MPGIKADFINPLEPRHICGLCELVIRSPIQADCGHIFCNDCLKEAMSSGEKMLCPVDGEKISQMFHADNACRREIQRLEVRCRYAKNNGCPWTGPLSTEDVHYITCEYRDEQCPNCGSYMIWTKLKKHAEVECPMRSMVCRYCLESIPVSYEKLHIQKECPGIELPCPNNCDPYRTMKRRELNKHLSAEDGDCPFSVVDCPYRPLGCDFNGVRSLLHKHLQENEIHHHRLLVKNAPCNTQQNSRVKQYEVLKDQLSNMEMRVNNLEKGNDTNVQRIKDLEERMSIFQNQYTSRVGYLEKVIGSGSHSMPTVIPRCSIGIEVAMLQGASSQLLRRVPELFAKQEETSRNLEKLMSSSIDQELRIQLLEQATHNGVLVWKIDEVARRMDEAAIGITVSLFSAPFYTDPRGYKMCARCYLNGDGMGKGTHFSLFFVVMRGLYDALLRWPFRQRITMTLLNQSGGRHVSDTFRPNVRSSSFQRPVNRDMNIASGCPRFIQLDEFQHGGFVKEDCIFIKVVVDCSDLYGSPMC